MTVYIRKLVEIEILVLLLSAVSGAGVWEQGLVSGEAGHGEHEEQRCGGGHDVPQGQRPLSCCYLERYVVWVYCVCVKKQIVLYVSAHKPWCIRLVMAE